MELPKDLDGIRDLPWAPYAGRNLSYFFTSIHLRETYGKLYEKFLGIRFSYIFVEADDNHWQMYRSPKESERLEKFVYEKTRNEAYVQDILERTGKGYDHYRRHAEERVKKDYRNASTNEMADALGRECSVYLNMIVGTSCAIIFASALARRLQETVPEEAVARMALPLYMTLPLEEEIAFWKLVEKIQKHKNNKINAIDGLTQDIRQAIQTHYDAYSWLDAYENEPVWKMEDFIGRINAALGQDGATKAHELEERHEANEKLVNDTAEKHRVPKQQLKQFRLAMYYRILGESLVGLANQVSRPLFFAIAKKLFLPRNQIKWFSDEELLDALQGKVEAERLLAKLPERQKHYVIALGKQNVHAFEGPAAQAFLDQLEIEKSVVENVTELKGVSAYPGKVKGIARVVHHVGQVDKVKTGDILVTLNTTPSFILAMKRSAAIVTDEGGITCHAAIVSRELGIPCIIGTKAGTRLIPDGALIEVDAAAGIVRKIEE